MSDWKFDLDEVGEDAESGSERGQIERESPSIENVIPFLIGMGLAVGLFVQLI
ncbi:MAG: hypothetical protein ABEJ58_01190 [Halodesulfurarchaeum sp.]